MTKATQIEDYPRFVMMVGVAGSGKSTQAKKLVEGYQERGREIVLLSSDAIREEIYGDESIQGSPSRVFKEMHDRTMNNLSNGIDVVYDATNLQKKYRIALLKEIRRVIPNCLLLCINTNTSLEECIANNLKRERRVPEDIIKRQYSQKQEPTEDEGWDSILEL